MIITSFLAFALLVALLIQNRANGRDRQELISQHSLEMARADRAHRLEMAEVRRQLDEQMVMAKHERAEMFDRLSTTAADHVAAVVRDLPDRKLPEKPAELPVIHFDDDLGLAEILSQ